MRKATLAGLGIALLPPAMTKSDLQTGRLVSVLPQYHRTGYGLHVLYPSRQHLPLAVSAFIGLVLEKLEAKNSPRRLVLDPIVEILTIRSGSQERGRQSAGLPAFIHLQPRIPMGR